MLVALLWLCSCCHGAVSVLRLFLMVARVDLCSVIVAFPEHTHLLMLINQLYMYKEKTGMTKQLNERLSLFN